MIRFIPICILAATAQAAFAGDPPKSAAKNWPAFRGPLATGEAPNARPPTEWSEEKNIRWKVAIPGRGHATPIIWGDRVYIQTAVETDKDAPVADGDGAKKDDDEASPPPRRRRGNRPPEGARPDGDRADPMPSLPDQPGGGDRPPPDGEGRRRGPRGRGGFGPKPPPKHLFDFQVIALDRKTGKTIWATTVKEVRPHEGGHGDASQASNSPVTDGENIYAYFGSRGLHCLSPDGEVKWSVDLGQMKTRMGFGEGSSPALHGDTIVINWDHEGDDFIVAIDKHTGNEKWRTPRDEHTTWSTPLVVQVDGKPQVVVSATNHIEAYDLATGKELWRCKGMTESVIPSPMAAGDLFYAISGFKGAACLAIRYPAAHGDITDSDIVAWKYDKDTPYVPSALLMNERLYFVENTKPLLTCLNAKTGKKLFGKERLAGIEGVYASILGANGHVYVVGRNGTTVVLKDGPEFKVQSTNKLDDEFDASPAAAGNELFLRGTKNLYCIAE